MTSFPMCATSACTLYLNPYPQIKLVGYQILYQLTMTNVFVYPLYLNETLDSSLDVTNLYFSVREVNDSVKLKTCQNMNNIFTSKIAMRCSFMTV